MQEFTLQIPTKIIFGRDTVPSIGTEAAEFGKKALLVYGGGSIKKNGVYAGVTESLRKAGIEIVEHPGVKPNPVLSHAEKGAESVKENGIDMIIAAGGGSVIDEGKAIAIGGVYNGHLWDFFTHIAEPESALPLLAVQTMPATSSEMNMISVLTNENANQKFSCRSPLLYPKVSILDPAVTLTIPPDLTAYACTDIMAHAMEGYFSETDPWPVVQQGYAEGMMRAVKLSMDKLLDNFDDFQARSAVLWAGALTWNGVVAAGLEGAGVPNHMLEHPLSAYYDVTHGAGLSVILPAWLKYNKDKLAGKLTRFGTQVLDMNGSDKPGPDAVIETLENWYRSIGTPVSFSELGIDNPDIDELTREALELCSLWGIEGYDSVTIREIYRLGV